MAYGSKLLTLPGSGRERTTSVLALVLANLVFVNFVCMYTGSGALRTPSAVANQILAALLAAAPLLLVGGPGPTSMPPGKVRWRERLGLVAVSLLLPMVLCLLLVPGLFLPLLMMMVAGNMLLELVGLAPMAWQRPLPAWTAPLLHAVVATAIVATTRPARGTIGTFLHWCVQATAWAVPSYWLLGSLFVALTPPRRGDWDAAQIATCEDAGALYVARIEVEHGGWFDIEHVEVEQVTTLVPGVLQWSRSLPEARDSELRPAQSPAPANVSTPVLRRVGASLWLQTPLGQRRYRLP